MSVKQKKVRAYGIKCPVCLDELYSIHRHDFRWCTCDYCFVDGGLDYLRYGWGIDGVQGGGNPKRISKLVSIRLIGGMKYAE